MNQYNNGLSGTNFELIKMSISIIQSTYSAMAKSTRNSGQNWTKQDVGQLKKLAKENTPTRVIGLKLGRTENSIRSKASQESVSLKPTNQSPYNRRKKS